MTFTHKQLALSFDSIYLGRIDPVKKTNFKVNDIILVCSKNGDAISLESLDILDHTCPFCGENTEAHSKVLNAKHQISDDKKVVQKPDPGKGNRRYRPIPWAIISIFAIIVLVLGFAVGAALIYQSKIVSEQAAQIATMEAQNTAYADRMAVTATTESILANNSTQAPISPTFTAPAPTLLPVKTETPIFKPTSALRIGSTMASEKDGMEMVYVPEGDFIMGRDDGMSQEKPAHKVFLDAFWIDRTEVTDIQYAACVSSGICGDPHYAGGYSRTYYFESQYANYPIHFVNWLNAKAYCEWAGRRLPTEAEWEKAARGTDNRIYPWGNEAPNCRLANITDCRNLDDRAVWNLSPVGSLTDGKSPYGALDMIGNVAEWVADWYDPSYFSTSSYENPQGAPPGKFRLLRGGSSWLGATAVSRMWAYPDDRFYGTETFLIGFRCAMDANP